MKKRFQSSRKEVLIDLSVVNMSKMEYTEDVRKENEVLVDFVNS